MKINVLGTIYTVQNKAISQDEYLKRCDGYCDSTSKHIVVAKKKDTFDGDNFDAYRKKCLRHEIVHAFLNESGLQADFNHSEWGHDETTVDWFAIQGPKIYECWSKAGAI